jgi:hypothetical protein
MSRDDYISKLFIDNEHKLDETPSDNLWDRLEAKLDKELPVDQPHSSEQLSRVRGGRARTGRPTSFMRFAPYMAAASVLILVVAIASVMKMTDKQDSNQALAENMTMVEDVLLEEETQPIITSEEELEKQFAEKDKEQEEKIIESVKRNTNTKTAEKVASLDDVELKEAESKDIILIEPEVYADALMDEEAMIEVPTVAEEAEDIYSNRSANSVTNPAGRQLVKPQDFIYEDDAYGNVYNNRGYGVPPSADPSLAQKLDEIEEKSATNSSTSAKKEAEDFKSKRRGLKSRKNNKSKNRKAYDMHPRIKIFDWMLGKFEDKSLNQGKSIESWRLINPNTIEGVGILMKGNDKIFEEKILIVHDPTQNRVFLKMYVDERKQQVTYLLTNFDTERIVFEQVDNKNAPNKVIFQRLLNGFTTIIQQDSGFIEDQQQRYLDHRNNVSNVRAMRSLESMD